VDSSSTLTQVLSEGGSGRDKRAHKGRTRKKEDEMMMLNKGAPPHQAREA
jgi:hypothetical protein